MTTGVGRPVRVELLAQSDCQSPGMARIVVERASDELHISAEVTVVEIANQTQARKRGSLGSPSVRVDGLDVEPGRTGRGDHARGPRISR